MLNHCPARIVGDHVHVEREQVGKLLFESEQINDVPARLKPDDEVDVGAGTVGSSSNRPEDARVAATPLCDELQGARPEPGDDLRGTYSKR